MKKQLFVFAGLFVITIALVSWNTRSNHASKSSAAVVINDFGCGLIDGDGNFWFADASHSVINQSGTVLKCSAKGAPNSTGKAVQYKDFLCGTFLGLTDDSHEVVSKSGNITLTCNLH